MNVDLARLADILLNVTIVIGLGLDIPVALLVLLEASKAPRSWALILFAYVLVGIAAIVVIGVWGAANQAAGYPVPSDVVRFVFRAALLFLASFAPLFMWVRLTGRFDAERGS